VTDAHPGDTYAVPCIGTTCELRDLHTLVGRHIGVSSWLLIDQDTIDQFADLTNDRQWIHVDPVRASTGPYGTTVAHGMLTFSLLPQMLGEVLRIEGADQVVNYGCEHLRFPAPVPAASRVRGHVDLIDVQTRPAGTLITTKLTVESDHAQKPVLVASMLSLASSLR
jgi:acyl dehydratase